MSAFLIASVKVHSADWVPEYLLKVPVIVRSHGGKFLGVSKNLPGAIELVEGAASTIPDGYAVMTFPSMHAVEDFLKDPDYQPHKEARIAGSTSQLFAFENNDEAPQFIGQ